MPTIFVAVLGARDTHDHTWEWGQCKDNIGVNGQNLSLTVVPNASKKAGVLQGKPVSSTRCNSSLSHPFYRFIHNRIALMSASSPDLERQVSDTTQVGEDHGPGDLNPIEERSNIDQASPADGPYDYASSRRSGPSNPRPPFTPSEAEVKEQMGEKPWRCGDPRHYDIPKNGDAWQKCHAMVEKHDNEMCDAWRDEVDKLLIFAGLFSGVVTAFTIQSYQWLHEHSADSSARLLSFIATQLVNSTNPLPPSLAIAEFTVTQAQMRINVVWFLSLSMSLTTVLVGILCLQWLREFQRDATLSHKDAVVLRQMRYEGLTRWHIPGILSILPLLLQLSLILFFVGLLDLLWSLNTPVAACVSAVVGMDMLFLIATTALPALQQVLTRDKHLRVPQCPYKSPQSWLFYSVGRWFFYFPLRCYVWLTNQSKISLPRLYESLCINNWLAYDERWRKLRNAEDLSWGEPMKICDSHDVVHGLHWINKTLAQSVEAIFPVYHSLVELDILAAAATISEIYLEIRLLDNTTFLIHDYAMFETLMNDWFSPNEMQKRDIIAAYYLKLYQDRHPVVKIWILNMQNVPPPCYRWLSQILWDLRLGLLPAPVVTQLNTNKIIIQALLCVNTFITRDILCTDDAVMAWILLRQLLTLPPSAPPNSTHPTNSEPFNLDHIKLAGGFFKALEGWLSRGQETDQWVRVKVCAEGMMRLFSSPIDIAALNDTGSALTMSFVALSIWNLKPRCNFAVGMGENLSLAVVPNTSKKAGVLQELARLA
ncbi:uncharacterized protein LACBIDRAFT_326040 [Laccaria bicolor S238N-H82]|uniref:Predicted protein n=1 Tax=Laccaria bicolor (strain S238N-H82 / ATCC MYA-4686) TaxID=486041 RepID=B0D738_LACBS|nr:uncharacterized protein LACBIDRAFT_326040 [Laccaria bicolor S238N-H82]EDR09582.1 predicted protein [Laccaria bicolor S238N-H82]|eukprot:XP_001879931.1 predicted protein [Laccaria bicolor S238N-H82]